MVWVITKTAAGFLAAGEGSAPGGGTQAVIWTSRDGLTWQRMTAAGSGLAGPGETVRDISYATYRDGVTLIAGTVTAGGASYSGAWLSANGAAAWTRLSIPVSNGAGDTISGVASDGAGLIAVRPGGTAGAASGVAYFSPNGLAWRYAGTINAVAGWSPGVVKGTEDGFVAAGPTAAGDIVAYTSTGAGTAWRPTASLGRASAESVTSVTLTPDGTVVAVGATRASPVSQRPVFLEATTAGGVRTVSVPGDVAPELTVNSMALSRSGSVVAVGSADGHPAVWQGTPGGGTWHLVSSPSLASAYPGLTALTSVTYGPAGSRLACPVRWCSPRRTGPPGTAPPAASRRTSARCRPSRRPRGRPGTPSRAAPPGRTAAAWRTSVVREPDVLDPGPGHERHHRLDPGSRRGRRSSRLRVGRPARPAARCVDHDRWAPVDDDRPGQPAGASSAVLRQVAVKGDRVVALGQAITAGGPVPFAELSADGGASWRQVPFSTPGPGTVITALTAASGGFTAAGQYGAPGRRAVVTWTSATGSAWTPAPVNGLGDGGSAIASLASSGSAVTAIGSVTTPQGQRFLLLPLAGYAGSTAGEAVTYHGVPTRLRPACAEATGDIEGDPWLARPSRLAIRPGSATTGCRPGWARAAWAWSTWASPGTAAPVAVKVLRPELADDPVPARFRREVRR